MPRKPKNLHERLENEVEEWGKKNSPLIFKAEGYVSEQSGEYAQGFVLLQDPDEYMNLLNLTSESSVWSDYARYANEFEAVQIGKSLSFKVHIKNSITTDEEMKRFIELIDYILSLVKVVM